MTDQTIPVPVALLKEIERGGTYEHDYLTGASACLSGAAASALKDIVALIPAQPKVGDTIDAAEQIAALPDHSVLIDADGEPWTVVGGEPLYYVDGKREGRGLLVRTYGPLTLVHVGTTSD